ncbi:hypothetical protein [Geminisphaera colitermitum]|uniref:hypothetical protein n=1 Tax=Geminisphaera colitermitum TaxID=1148786 RepID=UPI000158C78B|nr:hypothetical protein [Geminisphaera colitermitum]
MTHFHSKPRRTFEELYCEQREIPRGDFARHVLLESLHPTARVLYPLIVRMSPDYFEADLELVESAGELRSMRGFGVEVARLLCHPGHRGLWRGLLDLRISVSRLQRLMRRTLYPELFNVNVGFGGEWSETVVSLAAQKTRRSSGEDGEVG